VEQPASLIGALYSPHDKSADKRQSLETKPISRGTESSNPSPFSEESATNLTGKIEPALARNRRFESSSLRQRVERTVIGCLQPIARAKVGKVARPGSSL
jgi:hypothetical protein